MQWQTIRHHYPDQWLLLEAIKAHSDGEKRILDQLAVVGVFPDSVSAFHGYTQLHREAPERELYVFHTSREVLDIHERQWFGVRSGQSSSFYPQNRSSASVSICQMQVEE